MFRLVLGVFLLIIGLILTLISHHVVFALTRGDILHWEYLDYSLRIEYIRWMAIEILGAILLGIGLGILFYDLKKSILKSQS